jgi:D-alanine--poly(phosphoribitol) ligase subunit 1
MKSYQYNLNGLWSQVVERHGKMPALQYIEQQHISFAVLDGWADSLAVLLRSRGCQMGDVIAIGHNKKPLSFALMLAALRCGVAYACLDVASPIARTQKILQTCCPRLLFYDDRDYSRTMEELSSLSSIPLVMLEESILPVASAEQRAQLAAEAGKVDGATIAYVMFTSGSTGNPKGVAVTHQNVLHFIAWGQGRFLVTESDNFANLSPMYFDNSVFDFYVGLFSGASLSPIPRELLTQPYEMAAYIGKLQCTIWFSVPSLLIYMMTMKALRAEQLPALRALIFGGEGYPKIELQKLYRQFSSQAVIVNVYGPTECTCICSAYDLTAQDFEDLQGLPTLGHLNQNFDYLILDDNDSPADTGELCLVGPNVASGYFNDLERTQTSFVTLTDSRRFMKRMYRTGDVVREAKGQLFFVGRKDNQVKHLGYRIELEEIEYALLKAAGIRQAAVVYHRVNDAYGKLVGFVDALSDVEDKIVLAELSQLLPAYMIPSRIVVMDCLPKNPNGKVDRQALLRSLNERSV